MQVLVSHLHEGTDDGAKAAAGRRDLAQRLEEGRRREIQASYLAHKPGQDLFRSGQLFVM